MTTKLLGVVGSLRKNSLARCATEHVLARAKTLGAEVRFIDLLENPLPLFNPDRRKHPEYLEVLEHVNWANAFILGSPDYHGSMSGTMKNFLDYFWKEFAGKLFGYVVASHEKGLTVMDHMRTSIRQCYGWSIPYGVSVVDEDFPMIENVRKVGNTTSVHRLELLAYDLNLYTPLLRKQFESDAGGENPKTGFASHYQKK
jgi:azobenzene reductase